MTLKNYLRFTLLVMLILTVTSCSTYKRVSKNPDKYCHLCSKTIEVVTEYKDTIIYKIKEVEVPLPQDTVYITKTMVVKNGVVNLRKQIEKNGIITVEYGVVNSKLWIESFLNDSTVTYQDTAVKEISSTVKKTDKVITITKKHTPAWMWFLLGAGMMFTFWLGRKFS